VPPRLSATERVRAQIDELFASKQDLGQVLEQVARLSVRLVMQAALEAEISKFLGRDRYARGERERAGYRNGHAELTVKPTAGPVVLGRPKLRGTAQPFASRLLGKGVSRTNALQALVISGFARGLSTRDKDGNDLDGVTRSNRTSQHADRGSRRWLPVSSMNTTSNGGAVIARACTGELPISLTNRSADVGPFQSF
jgi:putative transposase